MPLLTGKDTKGDYYRWGKKGTKYYFKKGVYWSDTQARFSAIRQGRAIEASKSKSGKGKVHSGLEGGSVYRYF